MKNLYDEFIKFLKSNNKSVEDILYITSYREYEDENQTYLAYEEFNIPMESFIDISKQVNPLYSSLNMRFVGKDFFMTSDAELDGYFSCTFIPAKAKKTINLAKEMLLFPENKPGVLLGIEDSDQTE